MEERGESRDSTPVRAGAPSVILRSLVGSAYDPRNVRNYGDVEIPMNSGELSVFVSNSGRAAPRPGVAVLHEAGGMKEDQGQHSPWYPPKSHQTNGTSR